jgi:cytoskeletal protein CcmA (bactofilin family)
MKISSKGKEGQYMNGVKKFLLAAGALLAVVAVGVGVASATTINQVVSGVSNRSLYKAGQTVTITGTVNGDIFCAGQTIDIDATVNGDVICAGQTVTVNGTVNGNVRLAGQSVNLNAKVNNNATIAAQQASIDSGASVGGDTTLLSQSALVNGQLSRDLNATVSQLTVNSSIGRDINATVNTLVLDSGAKIARNITYTGPNKLTKNSSSTISGGVYYTYSSNKMHNHGSFYGVFLGFQAFLLLAFLLLGLVLIAIFPQLFLKWNSLASERFWAVMLTGLIASILVGPIIGLLLITVLGIPLAVLVGALWLIALILSAPLSAFYIGRMIMSGRHSVFLILLVGAVALGLISLIPILGEVVIVIAIWFGVGSTLLNLKESFRKPDYKIE